MYLANLLNDEFSSILLYIYCRHVKDGTVAVKRDHDRVLVLVRGLSRVSELNAVRYCGYLPHHALLWYCWEQIVAATLLSALRYCGYLPHCQPLWYCWEQIVAATVLSALRCRRCRY